MVHVTSTTEIVKTETFNIIGMTRDEAETLYVILKSIGGDPFVSRRKHCDSISKVLRDLIRVDPLDYEAWKDKQRHCIYFNKDNDMIEEERRAQEAK